MATNKAIAENIKKLAREMRFSKSDIDDEVDFYYECEYEADNNESIHGLFYKTVDMIKGNRGVGTFDASGSVKDAFNKLVTKNVRTEGSARLRKAAKGGSVG